MAKIILGFLKIFTDDEYILFSNAYRNSSALREMWAGGSDNQRLTLLRITLDVGKTSYTDRFGKHDILTASIFLTSAAAFSVKLMYVHRARIYQVSSSMIRAIRQIRIKQLKDYLGNIKQKKPIFLFRDAAVCLAFCSITGYSLYTFKALYDSQWLTLTFETLTPELMERAMSIVTEGVFYALIASFPLPVLKPKEFKKFIVSSLIFQSCMAFIPCARDPNLMSDFCFRCPDFFFNLHGGDICISRDMSQKPRIANSILDFEACPKNEKNYDLISRLETYPLQKEFIIVPEWPIQEKIEMSSMDDLNLKGKIDFPKNDEIITNVKQLNNSALNDLTGALEQLNQNFQAPIEQAPVKQSLPKKAKVNKYSPLRSRTGTLENTRLKYLKEEEFYQEIEIQNKYQHTDIASRYRQKRLSILENNKKNN
jgi:hypothetical protein